MAAAEPILTVAQVQAAEQALFDGGMESYALMQRAGRAAAEWVWRISGGRPVSVLCGPGNNGGDGYVIAQALFERGCDVAAVSLLEPVTRDAKRARGDFEGPVLASCTPRTGEVAVDCVFGSGQNRPLSDELAEVLSTYRMHHALSVAVDLPSGVESDTGKLLNDLNAHCATLALGAWKWAHWASPAVTRMGRRILIDIGLDAPDPSGSAIGRPSLSAPAADAHKYSRGLVVIVAGAMPGAALLSARAAQHAGAGYVKILSDSAVPPHPDSIVVDAAPLDDAIEDRRISAILVGPGLGRDDAARRRLLAALHADTHAPRILDADALHLLRPGDLDHLRGRVILTPHAGELAALGEAFGTNGKSDGALPSDLEDALKLALTTGAVVIAKGHASLVAGPDGQKLAAGPAPSWLSTAGTGDVLAGIVASRAAAGSRPLDAAAEGIWLHAEAARLAGPSFSADDLADAVRPALAQCL